MSSLSVSEVHTISNVTVLAVLILLTMAAIYSFVTIAQLGNIVCNQPEKAKEIFQEVIERLQ